jgi:ABC-type amino acid transport substrate-binding protein
MSGCGRLFSLPVTFVMSLVLLLSSASHADTLSFLVQKSQPKYFLDNGDDRGLCGDIYALLKKRLEPKGIKVEVSAYYTPIKRILLMVETGRADAFCGAGRNEAREKRFVYSKNPVYDVSNIVVTHRDNPYVPQSYQDLYNARIQVGALYGTSGARHLKEHLGNLVVDRFHTVEEALRLVAKKRLPFFYYHDLGLLYQVKNSELPIKALPTRFRTVSQWMIYSKKTTGHLRKTLDQEVSRMVESGEIDRIWDKYRK